MGEKTKKVVITNQIVKEIKSLNPPGRFLKKGKKHSNRSENLGWENIGEEATIAKTRQALRVGANTIKNKRHEIRRSLSAMDYSVREEVRL